MTPKSSNRRELLKTLLTAGSAITAAGFLPSKWLKPTILSGLMPAHAKVSVTKCVGDYELDLSLGSGGYLNGYFFVPKEVYDLNEEITWTVIGDVILNNGATFDLDIYTSTGPVDIFQGKYRIASIPTFVGKMTLNGGNPDALSVTVQFSGVNYLCSHRFTGIPFL